jgi:hypothetical protein
MTVVTKMVVWQSGSSYEECAGSAPLGGASFRTNQQCGSRAALPV